jgi:dihydropteroate synthase
MMQPVNTDYGGKMLDEVARVLKQRADSAQLAGIPRWNIILDAGTKCFHTHTHTHTPHRSYTFSSSSSSSSCCSRCAVGIGFAKTADHNLEILRRLKPLHREVSLLAPPPF